MSYLRKAKFPKLVASLVGFSMILSVVFTGAPVANAQTSAELQAQISSLLATIQALQAQLANMGGSTGGSCSFTFTSNLSAGSTGSEVKNVQAFLNMSADTRVSATGAGSPGNETMYFGPATKAAVIKFQNKYASEVLAPVGLTAGTGFWGASSRAKANALCSAAVPPVVVPPVGTPTTGTSLMVAAGTQPAATLAPENAARVPFTRFTLTAGADGAVTVNGVTVERVGLAANAVFDGVVLLDDMGNIMDVDKTLNANNQATIGGTFIVPAGTTKSYTIAGNMVADNSTRTGQVVGLNLVAVNTTATVSGSLPISGASHTVNSTLDIGTVTAARGANDPNAAASKEVGTADYTFTSVKLTAGSAEKIRLNSIRFNQSGSASASDLANVKVWVDGTAYTPVVSTDGKYYTANFGSGIVVDKGLSKEITLKGDITGGSARTIAFDIYKFTDMNVTGETFGYGITATAGTGFAATNPVFDASVVTVSNGSMVVSKSPSVAAGTVAISQANQTLGAFDVDVKGEPISVGGMVFKLQLSTGEAATQVDNVTLVSGTGAVLAGPVDATGATVAGTVTFSDTITFPIGKTTIILKGQLTTDFEANDTIVASTTPSTSATASNNWTTVKGTVTGNTIYPTPYSAVTGPTMTVKSATVTISTSASPVDQTVVAGAQGFTFANYLFDAGNSGEDVKFTTLSLDYNYGVAADDIYLTNCQLFDGATPLNTGSNVVNPDTASSGTAVSFTLDSAGLLIPKGTAKTVALKCNVSSSVTTSDTFSWDIDNAQTGSGATSGATVSVTGTGSGATMTGAASGSYTVTNDSSVLYKAAQAGATGVELGKLRFTAGASEPLYLKQIALTLGNTASNSPADLVGQRVSLWNGATQVGTAQFGGSSADFATSTTLSPAPLIAAGESVLITIKGDLSPQNVIEGTPGAFLAVNYDGNNNGINGNYASGFNSGSTISGGTTSDVATNGLRIFRTVPSIAVISNGGTLTAGGDLYKFTVTNPNSRDVVFKKFTFSVATTGGNTNVFTLYGDGVAFNTSAVTLTTTAQDLEINAAVTSQAKIIPANSTKTYILKATTAVDTASVSETINLALLADTSFPALAGLLGTVTTVEAGSANTDNIIWSPFSTTTPVATSATEGNLDWVNGYGLPGFPSNTAFPVQTFIRAN